jgi:hypothetical protein
MTNSPINKLKNLGKPMEFSSPREGERAIKSQRELRFVSREG